ncbi:MAG: TolC family protein, partial [Candidatus Saccharimonas sp.]|nr:TolC family protein [Planctomycetaceae bacterium]
MRGVNTLLGLMGMTSLVVCGCLRHAATPASAVGEIDTSHYEHLAKQIEFPDHPTPSDDLLAATPSPMSLATPEAVDYLGLSLEETMHLALANSPVLRELGGAILRTADNSRTKYDPSITESDPQTGIEGALSAFDAQFTSN